MILLERPALADFPPVGWQILYAGILSVGIAYTIQLVAQKIFRPHYSRFYPLSESVFAAWAGWQFLNQQLSWMALTGCGLIFIAVCLADVLPRWLVAAKACLMQTRAPTQADLVCWAAGMPRFSY